VPERGYILIDSADHCTCNPSCQAIGLVCMHVAEEWWVAAVEAKVSPSGNRRLARACITRITRTLRDSVDAAQSEP
jgi:hypothetical protein